MPIEHIIHKPDGSLSVGTFCFLLSCPLIPLLFALSHRLCCHSVAKVLLAAGVDLKVVSEMLGHSSVAITADIYAHVLPEQQQEIVDKMDDLLQLLRSGIAEAVKIGS